MAGLARLSITPEEEEKYTSQLSAILDYVDQLQELDISLNTSQDFAAVHTIEELRADVRDDGRHQSEILTLAPTREDGYFSVPAVFGNEE